MRVRIYDNNIRCIPVWRSKGEMPWKHRSKGCIKSILRYCNEGSAIVCLQEVVHKQLNDILSGLGEDWAHVGRGRGKKPKNGEYSPIIYRKSIWEVVSWTTKWLSPTPDIPSKGWGANLPRIVTIAEFRHRETQVTINVLCTHFDHQKENTRAHSGEFLEQLVCSITGPVFVAGDFNGTEDEIWYNKLSSRLQDAAKVAPSRTGPSATYVGFSGHDAKVIDYIWTNMNVESLSIGLNEIDNVVFSDHRPLVCDVLLA